MFDKNPVVVFIFSSFSAPGPVFSSPDFDSFGGIPVNTFSLGSALETESKELYWFDRRITCSITINEANLGFNDTAILTQPDQQFPLDTQIDGAIIESIGAVSKSRLQVRALRRPNGTLFNPPNPIVVPNPTLAFAGTNTFLTGQPDAHYYARAGMNAHLSVLERIAAYEPPTLQILRQDVVA